MTNKTSSCCPNKKSGFVAGLVYGLIPHLGCIAFIFFSVLGATTASAFLKPLLLSRYFFHFLILLSLVFATVSALFYLRRHGRASLKYLLTLYGTTIAINLLLFIVILPFAANLGLNSGQTESSGELSLQVDIPCSGHASLIIDELKTIEGVASVKFSSPNLFSVSYDPQKTSSQKMLSLAIFKSYPATVIAGGRWRKLLFKFKVRTAPAALAEKQL